MPYPKDAFLFLAAPRGSRFLALALVGIFISTPCRAEEFLTCHSSSSPKLAATDRAVKVAPEALLHQVKSILHNFAGDDISAYFGVTPAIMITADAAPNAYVTQVNEIVLSKGLLKMVSSDAELAFVVAHELGHIMLRHNTNDSARYAFTGSSTLVREKIEREIQADRFALKLLGSSGFEQQSSITLLSRIAELGSTHGAALGSSYPSLDARLAALTEELSYNHCGAF